MTLNENAAALLDRHLASCAACRELAVAALPPSASAFAPGATVRDQPTLPVVDPSLYELGIELGRGGMGRVVEARDLRLGRPVAVKELRGRDRELAARFEREARITARLQHPGIVPIYEMGRWPDGTPFYAMRIVDGRTLHDAIAQARSPAARLALLPTLIAAAEAVAFAHAQRVVHRDVKPANILVGAYGETVVIDWGLAKSLDAAESELAVATDGEVPAELTATGAVIGTAVYMPPEQASGDAVDERADVYALGAILYHVLAGRPPYTARVHAELLREVKAGPPPPLAAGRRAPRDLVSIVDKAMARDPASRYPTARELAAELVRFQAGRMVEAHAYSTGERVARFATRYRALLVAVAVGLLALAGIGAAAVSRVLRERAAATATVRTLLEEKGRSELVAGNPSRALAFLAAAYADTDDEPLRFMLADATREVDAIEATLDCGGDVREMDVSPDGSLLAAACKDVGRVWRLRDHALVATLGPIGDGFDAIRFSHDGRFVITGGLDGYARVFDAATGAAGEQLLHAPATRITWLGLTPDDRTAITTGFDGTAQVWDVATGARLRVMHAGQLGLVGVHGRLSPDGKLLVTATLGGTLSGWDVATGALVGTLEHGGQILGGEMSPDSRLACTAGADRRVVVWDLATRAPRFALAGHSDAVWKCVFSPDGSRLATAGNDGAAKVWDMTTGALIASLPAGDSVWSVAWSPDGMRVATSRLDGRTQVWQASSGALLASHDEPFGGKAARFSVDGERLIAQRGDGRIRIWSRAGGAQRAELVPPPGARLVACESVDGETAAIAPGWDGVELWATASRSMIHHEPIAAPIAFAGDGRLVAARAAVGAVVIDARAGTTVARVPVHGGTSSGCRSTARAIASSSRPRTKRPRCGTSPPPPASRPSPARVARCCPTTAGARSRGRGRRSGTSTPGDRSRRSRSSTIRIATTSIRIGSVARRHPGRGDRHRRRGARRVGVARRWLARVLGPRRQRHRPLRPGRRRCCRRSARTRSPSRAASTTARWSRGSRANSCRARRSTRAARSSSRSTSSARRCWCSMRATVR